MGKKYSAFWFRRDLRLHDNVGLYHAISSKNPVICFFIFDKYILNQIENPNDARVSFIHENLIKLDKNLKKLGSRLIVKYGECYEEIKKLVEEYCIASIFTNTDYEPFASDRDDIIEKMLRKKGILFHSFKDHVLFEKNEIAKKDGYPYTVFTPYMKKWRSNFTISLTDEYPIEQCPENFIQISSSEIPTLDSMGFKKSKISVSPYQLSEDILLMYPHKRDFPALEATTQIGPHLRFGTISIREVLRKSVSSHPKYANELIWREFFIQILWNFPHVVNQCFRQKYENMQWRNNEKEFELWCNGQTGYPIVDAGMRELKQTGYMHNRVRMIVASFLCKHLLIDWRWGEAWFANHLLDYELASNNGNWQWAASCGCDAVPYFRIFNPYEQQRKFDPEMEYIRKWVPEVTTQSYITPIIDHKLARQRALDTYQAIKKNEIL